MHCFYIMVPGKNSLMRDVDELVDDNPMSLTIERRRGRFGRLTVHWRAYENLDDISPTSGVVSCLPLILYILVGNKNDKYASIASLHLKSLVPK